MALSMLRQGLQASRMLVPVLRLVPATVSVNKKRTIVSKQFKEHNPDKPAPWPYETTKFTVFEGLFENTQDRFDENSRIIVIEGNVGVGKSHLAKKLGEELDFLVFPEANMDMKYIDDEGFDLRSIEQHFPEAFRPCDIEKFYKNPRGLLVANFQYSMLALRCEQYLDALAHLLNTGQGVILERSPYTDFVFMEAMHKAGYVDDHDLEVYNTMSKTCRLELLRPHLVLYLDAPVDVLQQRIKNRGLPYEQNTSVLTPQYLTNIEKAYKESYLPSIQEQVEVVCYDWSTFGDPSEVVEDLERLPIDEMMDDEHSLKFEDWKHHNKRYWDHLRMLYTNQKSVILTESIYSAQRLNHPEILASPEEITAYNAAYDKYYPNKYDKGFATNTIYDDYLFRWDFNYRDMERTEFFRTR